MATSTVRTAEEFEAVLRSFIFERSEEARAVWSGEKETSEQAAIVARYADLFSREQLGALREAEEAEQRADERERVYRLRRTCEEGVIVSLLAPMQDALENAHLEARVEFGGDSIPLRSAQAQLAVLADYTDREELGARTADVSADLNPRRLELLDAWEELAGELSGELDPVARSEEQKGVSLRRLADVLVEASARFTEVYDELRGRWLERLLGPGRPPTPASYHAPYVYRLSALADVYSKDRVTDVCVKTLDAVGLKLASYPSIRTDLEDRPQKTPRPIVIPSDPPTVVHLITRSQGGLLDYQAFLHEAGHAFHYAGCDADLPYAFRLLARDNALTEIYSFLCESISHRPEWHALHFGLSPEQAAENAEAARFLYAFVLRRFLAKLRFELDFWSRYPHGDGLPEVYADRLTEATGFAYRADAYLSDMDSGFYSADYLRAWVRAAQLRSHLREGVGDDWWYRTETGELLHRLFREGTRPSNEEIADRIGFDPLDVGPLVAELAGR